MKTILERAGTYWRASGITGLGHYKSAEIAARKHRAIGIPSVALSAVVATSIFSTLSEGVHIGWRIATGVFALAAAILAALQAFLSFGDQAEKHKSAGARYGNVRRRIDLFIVEYTGTEQPDAVREEALEKLKSLAEELGKLASDSPTLPGALYDEAKEEFAQGHSNPRSTATS
jgi:hypothetical protein